jgi:EAL domain-containing protein (putative c-di-GMP-specific phosphodiesterase class I)/CheY-like chemotaxis protein
MLHPDGHRRILIVDDEEPLRRAFARALQGAGFTTQQAESGDQALEIIAAGNIDAVVSDINMPHMDGMALLRKAREHDLDLPIVMVTGNPTVDTAAKAIEYGALRYLVKPVDNAVLIDALTMAVKLRHVARLKREAATYLGMRDRLVGDRAGREASLASGLASLWMAYQPIVDPRERKIKAYEALVRTREPSLPNPGALFETAEQLDRVHDVGRAVRASIAGTLAAQPPGTDVFINLHPSDLSDEDLFAVDAPLTRFASQVVLEITERAALDHTKDVQARIRRLRNLGFRIAIDDLGAGYAGLSYFALLTPDVVKLDTSLIRDMHAEEIKRKLVGSITSLCQSLGMVIVAEGIETAEERGAAVELGCDLLQGYLFARPGPPFPEVNW